MAADHPHPTVSFQTNPSAYRHVALSVDGPIARIALNVQEEEGLRPDYALKLNSYDVGVDIELADAVQRMRFEHPEVTCVIITSALQGVFCSGANIFMLGTSAHAFKVNFCKYTNETRLYIEDATEHSGQTYIAALNGVASGGGYELPLACEEIYLVDDRRSAVALPLVAAGGIMDAAGVDRVLAAGAQAAQLGTALLRTEESGARQLHKDALASPHFTRTALTRAFTGRPARALVNEFVRDHPDAPESYPAVHHLTAPLRAAAAAAGDAERLNLWAGTGWQQARAGSVAEVMAGLLG